MKISGKMDFGISKSLRIRWVTLKFPMITRRRMDTGLAIGWVVSVAKKTDCLRKAEHAWKRCQTGFGMRLKNNGKTDFAILMNLQIEKGIVESLRSI